MTLQPNFKDELAEFISARYKFIRATKELLTIDKESRSVTLLFRQPFVSGTATRKVDHSISGSIGKQPHQKPTPPNPSTPIKRRIESYNAKPSITTSSFLNNSVKAAGSEAKQPDTKRVKFDLPPKSPSK